MEAEKRGALSKLHRGSIVIVPLVMYLIVLISLLYLTQIQIELVFIATMPFLFYLIFFFILFKEHKLNYKIVWVLPLIFPLVFAAIWYSKAFGIINRMEGLSIAVLNIIFSYIANVVFMFGYGHERKEKRERKPKTKKVVEKVYVKDTEEINKLHQHYSAQSKKYEDEVNYLKQRIAYYEEKLKITSSNLTVSLRSIEDKCKSINFVIGRVYGNKHGGNKEIRDKLRIDRELYNSFSEMTKELKPEDSPELLHVLDQLHNRLIQLEYAEIQILTKTDLADLKIDRDPNGKEQLLAVMAKNDNDPIIDYYAEAKEICIKMMDYLNGLQK